VTWSNNAPTPKMTFLSRPSVGLNMRHLVIGFNIFYLVVCFLLGDSPASEFYMPTFRNTPFHLHRQVGACRMN